MARKRSEKETLKVGFFYVSQWPTAKYLKKDPAEELDPKKPLKPRKKTT